MKKEGKMNARNTGFTKENNLIYSLLKENGDPAIDKLIKPADLAKKMGKQRSENSH